MINYRLSTSSGSCFKIEATENKFWRGHVFVCRSGGAWNVNEINVHEAFRRKGIGRRLYEFAAKESCKRGAPFRSGVQQSEKAKAFWKKQLSKGRARWDFNAFQIDCPAPASLDGIRRTQRRRPSYR